MKDKTNRYSRKPKKRLRDIFHKNKTLVQPLEEEISKPRHEVKGVALIFGYLGIFLIILGIVDLIPIISMIFYPNEFSRVWCFLIPGVGTIILGALLSLLLLKGKDKGRLGKYQDLILLVLIWASASVVCALPYMFPDYVGNFRFGGLGLDFTHAIFESVSGLATVGLTILSGNNAPSVLLAGDGHSILFFRSLTTFFGGIGFVLVLTCIISDTYGISLYYSEGHNDRLLPNLYKSAKLIFTLYTGLVLFGALALYLGGLNEWTTISTPVGAEGDPTNSSFFEALCMAMTHVPGGGFATRTTGVYAYNNLTIELIFDLLMIFGGTNFIIIFSAITLKYKKIIKDLDVRLTLIFALIFIPLLTIISSLVPSFNGTSYNFFESLRYNSFYYLSAANTCGANNTLSTYDTFSRSTLLIYILIMCFGAQQGSCTGGIKLYRIGIAIKSIYWTIKEKYSLNNIIYPHYVYKYGEPKEVTDKEVKDATTYILLYFSLLFFLTLIVTCFADSRFTFLQCLFEVASALSGTGLTVGVTYFAQNIVILYVLTIAMFIGRLEIYTFIYAGKRLNEDVVSFTKEKIAKHKYAKEQ
jgi:Trk-type K+ transport systems, membrane components